MRFTAVVNMTVIVLALAFGAAALPGTFSDNRPEPLAMGPSVTLCFNLPLPLTFCCLTR
jgi:hypothetical protein